MRIVHFKNSFSVVGYSIEPAPSGFKKSILKLKLANNEEILCYAAKDRPKNTMELDLVIASVGKAGDDMLVFVDRADDVVALWLSNENAKKIVTAISHNKVK